MSTSNPVKRTLIHITAGTDTWTPTSGQLHSIAEAFSRAAFDPEGGVVVTTSGVKVRAEVTSSSEDLIVVEASLKRVPTRYTASDFSETQSNSTPSTKEV